MEKLPNRPQVPSGPTRHVYDLIVLGGQFGGALAACLLAKRGYRVLHVEHDGLGHGYEHGGLLLPYAPFVLPPLKAMPAVEEALAELGLNTAVQRALHRHEPDVQLIFPQSRVDLTRDEKRRLAELGREFDSAGAETDREIRETLPQQELSDGFFKESPSLPPAGFFESFGLKRLAARYPGLKQEPALTGRATPTKLLRGLGPFLTYVDSPDAALALTRPLSQILKGPCTYPGGREGLRDLLTRKLLDLGGDFLGRDTSETAIAEELCFDGSAVVGVKVLRSDQVYRSQALIAATESGAFRRLLPDKKKHRALAETLDLVTVKSFLFSVNWVLRSEGLPKGMGELLLLEPRSPTLGPLLVQVSNARALGGGNDPSKKVVCGGAFVPASARDLGEEHLTQIVKEIEANLETLIPFFKLNLLDRSAPYLDVRGVRGSRLLPHPHYTVEGGSHFGVTGIPSRTPVKNLFIASREVVPGLGFEGECLAGIRAAKLVQDLLKKSDPLKRMA